MIVSHLRAPLNPLAIYISIMLEGFQGGPQLVLHDAERRYPLTRLYARIFEKFPPETPTMPKCKGRDGKNYHGQAYSCPRGWRLSASMDAQLRTSHET